jgi:hypothetical protein
MSCVIMSRHAEFFQLATLSSNAGMSEPSPVLLVLLQQSLMDSSRGDRAFSGRDNRELHVAISIAG